MTNPQPKEDNTTPADALRGERYRARLAVVQAALLCALPFVVYKYALGSGYLTKCPTQYGAVVLSLLMAGLASVFVGYGTHIVFEELTPWSRSLLVIGTFATGIVAVLTWLGLFQERRFDCMAAFVVAFSAIAAVVSYVEMKRNLPGRPQWRIVFWCVDLPLLVGTVLIVTFKYLAYNLSNEPYTAFMSEQFLRPAGGTTPEWFNLHQRIQENIRSSFWTGFTAGAITVQILASQLIAVILRLQGDRSSPGVLVVARRLGVKTALYVRDLVASLKDRWGQRSD